MMIFLIFRFETTLFGEALPDFERFFHIDMTSLITVLLPYVYKRISLDVLAEGLKLCPRRRCFHILAHFLDHKMRV